MYNIYFNLENKVLNILNYKRFMGYDNILAKKMKIIYNYTYIK